MTQAIEHRVLEPGTTGWTVDDLYDPEIQCLLSEGRFEIVDGVLTKMAPQGFEGIDPLSSLRDLLYLHLHRIGQGGKFHHEVDLLLRRDRVPRPDMIFLTEKQRAEQKQLQQERKRPRGKYHPVYVTPTLIVESVSVGTERHDRVTKRRWYAAAGVPHYWILTAHEHSLVCLVLDGRRYVEECFVKGDDIAKSSLFGGVSIPLSKVWDE